VLLCVCVIVHVCVSKMVRMCCFVCHNLMEAVQKAAQVLWVWVCFFGV